MAGLSCARVLMSLIAPTAEFPGLCSTETQAMGCSKIREFVFTSGTFESKMIPQTRHGSNSYHLSAVRETESLRD